MIILLLVAPTGFDLLTSFENHTGRFSRTETLPNPNPVASEVLDSFPYRLTVH